MKRINGNDLIKWGFKPGKAFRVLLKKANEMKSKGFTTEATINVLKELESKETFLLKKRTNPVPYSLLIDLPDNEVEQKNLDAVKQAMDVAMRVPVIDGGAVMPDACPAGVAPVGSVIKSKGIHPAYHSADVCCSVALTEYKVQANGITNSFVTDRALECTHFGLGKNGFVSDGARDYITNFFPNGNPFLDGLQDRAVNDLGTQGDGNHFLYLGARESSGNLCIVTHHGSRSFGANVYKRGIALARRECKDIASNMGTSSWFDPKSELGQAYWEALQFVRWWTKQNHMIIHTLFQKLQGYEIEDFFWNEHNFIFERDGYYYHAKGATPNYPGFSPDDSGKTLVPLNMGEPILVLGHSDNEDSLGFAPHGAGRDMSRSQYLRETDEYPYPDGVEVRFYTGTPDYSELPGAYKDARKIEKSIETFGIGKIVDRIQPIGSIMAGHIDWARKDRGKRK